MINNKKGFTLMEVMVTVLIIAILAAIGVPYYRSTVERTRITTNMPILKGLQDAVIQYYPQENEYPSKLRQLHVTLSEGDWTYSGLTATKKDGSCTISLNIATNPSSLSMTCKSGSSNDWKMEFRFFMNASGTLTPSDKYFFILSGDTDRIKQLQKAAVSSGWQLAGTNTYKIP